MEKNIKLKRALISVYNKYGIIKLAKYFQKNKIELITTNGTYNYLMNYGIYSTKISEYIDFPEIMNGRLKTLHYKIYGGILGKPNKDKSIMKEKKIFPIDFVIVNFYQTIDINLISENKFIENIDIGGPAMVRAAAKNYRNVSVITDVNEYENIIKELKNKNYLSNKTKLKLAIKAFEYTSKYENNIKINLINLFNNKKNKKNKKIFNNNIIFPKTIKLDLIKKDNFIKYGENKHQKSAFYIPYFNEYNNFFIDTKIKIINNQSLSYNNLIDTEFALSILKEFIKDKYVCVIIKHANPCGVAIGKSILESYNKAYKADDISAFGGVIAFNNILDINMIKYIIKNQFVEIIIASNFTQEALNFLFINKPNIKLIIYSSLKEYNKNYKYFMKSIHSGLIIQEIDNVKIESKDLEIVSKIKPNKKEIDDALFAWKIVKYVKSNGIVCVKNKTTIGIGAGQMSRIDATNLSILKARKIKGFIKDCVMASDGFLPFRDNIDIAAKNGIKCIIQPGGSIRDKEVISAVNENNLIMMFTRIRHFYH